MDKAAEGITTTEEIIVPPEESVDEVKEEIERPLLGFAKNCTGWQAYGSVSASDLALRIGCCGLGPCRDVLREAPGASQGA
jgi:hypothetical protein